MLPKSDRLRRAKDFALLSQKGRVIYSPLYALRLRPSREATKVGFVTSTKVFKTAVKRNRAKRRMREVLRMLKTEWPKHVDLLFILKYDVLDAAFEDLQAAVRRSFEKVPEALSKPPVPRKNIKARRRTSVVYRENP
ncbi:ribonuclease P protein component [Candidatus Uhrbacteria bacterium]|nr:MAG: ribonuclease P protein component [Candidatus Uhrbacteria bacterium]